jgi:hypothetical protein
MQYSTVSTQLRPALSVNLGLDSSLTSFAGKGTPAIAHHKSVKCHNHAFNTGIFKEDSEGAGYSSVVIKQ